MEFSSFTSSYSHKHKSEGFVVVVTIASLYFKLTTLQSH